MLNMKFQGKHCQLHANYDYLIINILVFDTWLESANSLQTIKAEIGGKCWAPGP